MGLPSVTEARELSRKAMGQKNVDRFIEDLSRRITAAANQGKHSAYFAWGDLNDAEKAVAQNMIRSAGYAIIPGVQNAAPQVKW